MVINNSENKQEIYKIIFMKFWNNLISHLFYIYIYIYDQLLDLTAAHQNPSGKKLLIPQVSTLHKVLSL